MVGIGPWADLPVQGLPALVPPQAEPLDPVPSAVTEAAAAVFAGMRAAPPETPAVAAAGSEGSGKAPGGLKAMGWKGSGSTREHVRIVGKSSGRGKGKGRGSGLGKAWRKDTGKRMAESRLESPAESAKRVKEVQCWKKFIFVSGCGFVGMGFLCSATPEGGIICRRKPDWW